MYPMTMEAITSLTAGCVAVIAVIDPSIQNISVAAIGAVVTITTVVFAFKTAALNKKLVAHDAKIQEVIKTSDGIKDALIRSTSKASLAEGVLIGVEKAEAKAAMIAEAKFEGKTEATS